MAAYIANFGAVTWTRPSNGTAATAYFALGVRDWTAAGERMTGWMFPGMDGEYRKKFGQELEACTLVGWVEASTMANLKTGMDAMDAEADGAPHTLNLYNTGSPDAPTFTFSSSVCEGIAWDPAGIQSAGGSRLRMGFAMRFKRLQTS